jgi:hypothetical protein
MVGCAQCERDDRQGRVRVSGGGKHTSPDDEEACHTVHLQIGVDDPTVRVRGHPGGAGRVEAVGDAARHAPSP